jgi:tRNA(Ile)-lysidine synthase
MPASPKNFPEATFVKAVAHTIATYRMFTHSDRVLVGVSGGPDSVALLRVLIALAPKQRLTLAIAHLDHGLRGLAGEKDRAFVASLAQELGLPCHVRREDVRAFGRRHGLSIEEAGRRCRYDFFTALVATEGFDKIAVGHQADDNAELVLMNVIRGSGSQGLAGIPPVREPGIVRPLIEQRRTAIIAYLEAIGSAYVTDQSNFDPAYLRNRIRRQLLPELEQTYNPRIIGALNRLAAIVREEKAWQKTLLQPLYERIRISASANRIVLSLKALELQPKAVRQELARWTIKQLKGELRRVHFRHIKSILALISSPGSAGRIDLPDRIQVVREGDALVFTQPARDSRRQGRPADDTGPEFEYLLHHPTASVGSLPLDDIGGVLHCRIVAADQLPPFDSAGQQRASFDIKKLSFPLTIRNIRAGDRFHPLGAAGTQKVKKYLIDHKIPRPQRRKTPVLLSRNRIIWLVGHRIDEAAKVDAATEMVFQCELLLA